MQSCLAIIKTAPFRDELRFYGDRNRKTEKLLLFLRSYPQTSQLRYFPVLRQIDTALQEKTYATFTKPRFQYAPHEYGTCKDLGITLQQIACEVLFHEYLQWKFKSTPTCHQVNEMGRAEYLNFAVRGIPKQNNLTRTKETLRVLFQQGCNPNASPSCDDRSQGPPLDDTYTAL